MRPIYQRTGRIRKWFHSHADRLCGCARPARGNPAKSGYAALKLGENRRNYITWSPNPYLLSSFPPWPHRVETSSLPPSPPPLAPQSRPSLFLSFLRPRALLLPCPSFPPTTALPFRNGLCFITVVPGGQCSQSSFVLVFAPSSTPADFFLPGDQEIESQIRRDRANARNEIKMLLLGAGESGKVGSRLPHCAYHSLTASRSLQC